MLCGLPVVPLPFSANVVTHDHLHHAISNVSADVKLTAGTGKSRTRTKPIITMAIVQC